MKIKRKVEFYFTVIWSIASEAKFNVPVVVEWGLDAGDELEWNWVVINNKMVMTVKISKDFRS